jgi:amidase/6-aminohexanoate-cyclic-dimer hydrolase
VYDGLTMPTWFFNHTPPQPPLHTGGEGGPIKDEGPGERRKVAMKEQRDGITRRGTLKLGGAALAVGAAELMFPATSSAMLAAWSGAQAPGPAFDEYARYDGLGLAALVKRGEVSPHELLAAALERMEAVDSMLNAVVIRFPERARAQIDRGLPDGPFQGVPFLLKDLHLGLEGTLTTNGSALFKGHVAKGNSTVVTRYQEAGLVIFGKGASPEFGLTPSTESALYGATHNPWDLEHSAGGSSGGGAAAVAAGIVPLANASDGGGSIRIPASCCGLFGMKPSRARVALGPSRGEGWNGLTCVHAITRSVRDSAALLDATSVPESGSTFVVPPPARPFLEEVGVPPGPLRIALMLAPLDGGEVDPECVRAVDGAAKLCESLGHNVEEAAPRLDMAEIGRAVAATIPVGIAALLEARAEALGRPITESDVEPVTWLMAQQGNQVRAVDHANARNLSNPEAFQQAAQRYTPFTLLFNVTGQPSMSVPLHWTPDGLPVGLLFTGRYGDEATLFRLASQLERAQPWADKRPAIGRKNG